MIAQSLSPSFIFSCQSHLTAINMSVKQYCKLSSVSISLVDGDCDVNTESDNDPLTATKQMNAAGAPQNMINRKVISQQRSISRA